MTADLGAYLKTRRGQVQPTDVGLHAHTPRRVPGLRREEVAMLAGVSVDYYARLEQGRERHPSPSVLNALANALLLDTDQREYVFRLAGLAPAVRTETASTPAQSLRDLLDAWTQTPAMIIDRQLNVLAQNQLAMALYSAFARPDNLIRMTFLDPAGRRFYVDWERAAESCVASLRLALSHADCADDVRRLIIDTSAGSDVFRRLWSEAHDVRGKVHDAKAFRHPAVGELVLDHHAFEVRSAPGTQLITYHATPSSPSAEKLQLLASLHATRGFVRE
ncbi:helix-turn-helix domain-containing protein [Nesterenkonia xinjiangensis]|uniref:Transcriptional regulator with XRE-family HTH domain n=1 Tax=Nesterenkonia xinjiangensis TaxID=225327 RepID=A0A7Z0GIP6_9MICC|nr:helix-turn-helix transcriptional regulator [Nesterenkonia xinjiangensis]NYJ76724.1 transcriptional regulator with XRE-family HTH domain [Nesterenkonia xinjiangensis]